MYYNYLLFVPSLLSRTETMKYKVMIEDAKDDFPEYEGIQTNEAMTKFAIDYLEKSGEALNKIIMLCTKEVQEERMEAIGNRTTLEFYIDAIKEYTKDKKEIAFEVVDYLPQNNENENQIMAALERIIQPDEETEAKKRLYVDFTGGSRSAALTLVFASRILDKAGVSVEKIFYSNIKRQNGQFVGSIEECTQTYYIFAEFERQIEIANGGVAKTKSSNKKNEGTKKLEDKLAQMNIDRQTNQTKNAKANKEEMEHLVKEIDYSNMSYSEKKTVEGMKKQSATIVKENDDPLFAMKNDLQNQRYAKALNDFREKIGGVLFDSGIIAVKDQYKEKKGGKEVLKGHVVNEIAASYGYYCNNAFANTFMDTVKAYLKKLIQHPEKSPQQIRDEYYGKDFFSVENYKVDERKAGFKHNNFSRQACDKMILPYINALHEKEQDFSKCVVKYNELDKVYMGYGFPFACTYGGNTYYAGYEALYKNTFNEGVNVLESIYRGETGKRIKRMYAQHPEETFTYENLLPALLDGKHEEMLRILFPYKMKTENIKKGANKNFEWNQFIYSFAKGYCVIKNVRNKSTHPKDFASGELKLALDEMTRLIAEIEELRAK